MGQRKRRVFTEEQKAASWNMGGVQVERCTRPRRVWIWRRRRCVVGFKRRKLKRDRADRGGEGAVFGSHDVHRLGGSRVRLLRVASPSNVEGGR
jgi:hypothetical protein